MHTRKFTTLALAGMVSVSAWAQGPNKQKFVSSPEKSNPMLNVKNMQHLNPADPPSLVSASGSGTGHHTPPPTAKVSSVNPVMLGSASNVFTIINGDGNQVSVDNTLNMVTFTHRNNASVFSGTSSELRYDLSTDGGVTWNTDIGPLNPGASWNLPARYPLGAIYNPPGNTDPLQAMNLYYAPTLGVPSWDGHVYGLSSTVASGSPTSTEHYDFQGSGTFLPTGLVENHPGEFWVLDLSYHEGTNPLGDIRIFTGIVAGSDITFTEKTPITPDHLIVDNMLKIQGAQVAWKPEIGGSDTGWVAFLGDLVGAPDSAMMPVFIKTTDGGNTWGTPTAFNLNSISWVADTLQSLWVNASGNPSSSGIAACGYDFDLTVDMNGNPHLVVVVGTRSDGPLYAFGHEYAKFLADCYSPDGGTTWDVRYISPVLTFRTRTFYGSGANAVTFDNQPQICRSRDGSKIFYAWVDSDTAKVTLSKNGVGFGISENSAPNLRVAALDVATGFQSYPQLVTDADATWNGKALWPTMAPEAIADGPNTWRLPIVMPYLDTTITDPVDFYYFGNDLRISDSCMHDPSQMTLTWPAIWTEFQSRPCIIIGVKPPVSSAMVLGNAWPNPTSGEAIIPLELSAVKTITLDLVNVLGQQVALIADGEFAAGKHSVKVSTDNLAAGVYYYNLRTDDQVLSKKLVVVK
ncbi:MAG: hypothetical protein RLZZ165_619 [Bacteroidota bacterium]